VGAHLDTSEVRGLGSRIVAASGRVGATASAALRKTAFDIEADAKALAPFDLGTLMNSISTTISGDGRFGTMAAEIGPTVEYGVYQELGTSVMGAQPYMGPAFDRNIGGYTEALAKIAELGI
jgi:HK97 gp10 family phage protein